MIDKNNLSAYIGTFSENEIELTHALAHCTFLPATNQKRFARDMNGYTGLITERQRWWLYKMIYRYRRQIAPELVARAILWLAENPEPTSIRTVVKPLVSGSADKTPRQMLATLIQSNTNQIELDFYE